MFGLGSDGTAGRTRLFGSLCWMVFLVNISRVVFAPMLEPFAADFGLSSAGAGLVATLAWVGSALPRVPTGYLLTRVPRHRVVLATGGMLTAAALFTAFATTPLMLYAGALTMGLAGGAYFIAANPLVSELYPDRVGLALGVHGMASQLAAVSAPLVVDLVLGVGTVAWPVEPWRVVFLLIGGVAGAATVVFSVVARRATMPTAGRKDRDFLGAFRAQWRIVLAGVFIVGTAGFVWNGVFNFYVKYMTDVKGLSPSMARTLLTLVFAAGVPAFLLTGRLADRVPYVPLLLAVVGGFAASLYALTLATGLATIVVATAVLGYVAHSLFPAIDTYLLDSLPDRNRASAYAVYSGSMMLVQANGSVVLGGLQDAGFAFDAVFRAYAAGLVGVLAVLAVLHRLGRLPTGRRDRGVEYAD